MAVVQCTDHCIKRFKAANGVDLPKMGDAYQWADYNFDGTNFELVDDLQKYGVACFSGGNQGMGHVIFIESVNSDGSFKYSEGNCLVGGHGAQGSSGKLDADSIDDYINQHHTQNDPDLVYEGCITLK